MDISNSSSDEENPVVTKKASFKVAVKVSYCSLVLEFIILFSIQGTKANKKCSQSEEEALNNVSVKHSIKNKATKTRSNNQQVTKTKSQFGLL